MRGRNATFGGLNIFEHYIREIITAWTWSPIKYEHLHVFIVANMGSKLSQFMFSIQVNDICQSFILLWDFQLALKIKLWNDDSPSRTIANIHHNTDKKLWVEDWLYVWIVLSNASKRQLRNLPLINRSLRIPLWFVRLFTFLVVFSFHTAGLPIKSIIYTASIKYESSSVGQFVSFEPLRPIDQKKI